MIELKQVYKQVGDDDLVVKILHDINLNIQSGEFVAIMGPSGSGKSTLMNIMGFLVIPSAGHYLFKGQDVSGLSEDQLALFRSQEVGFVFQAFNLLPKTSVLDNVKLPLMYSAKKRNDREQTELARQMIKEVGLAHRETNLSNQLSGGEKQRVAIARALINDPSVIFADEPTGNLDSQSGLQIMQILQQLNERGKTIILVTHEQLTAEFARRIVKLHDGRVTDDSANINHRRAEGLSQLK